MYLGLVLGLKFGLHNGIGPSYEHFSYILAIVPFVWFIFSLEKENKLIELEKF